MRSWKIVLSAVVLVILFALFLHTENNSVSVTSIVVENKRVPAALDGFKIMHISDLHSKRFGSNQQKLTKMIRTENPDMVAFTGDLVDRDNYDEEAGIALLMQALTVAPVYYVTGNHEWWAGRFAELEPKLVNAGITVLRDENATIRVKGTALHIAGVDDIAKFSAHNDRDEALRVNLGRALEGLPDDDFNILLAHRPEHVSAYGSYPVDLVLSGHTHGGQIRLPFIGGLIAPDQGFFPKYAAGAYDFKDMTLIINRGLGNSVVPQRIFNRPELILITLRKPAVDKR